MCQDRFFRLEHEYRDGPWLRTGEEAYPATGAALAQIHRRMIAVRVQLLAQLQDVRRTRIDTKLAAFAFLFGDFNSTAIDFFLAFVLHFDCSSATHAFAQMKHQRFRQHRRDPKAALPPPQSESRT